MHDLWFQTFKGHHLFEVGRSLSHSGSTPSVHSPARLLGQAQEILISIRHLPWRERKLEKEASANCRPSLAYLLVLTWQFSNQLFTHPAFPQLLTPDLWPASPPSQLPWGTPPCQVWPVASCDATRKGCIHWWQEAGWVSSQHPDSWGPHSTSDAVAWNWKKWTISGCIPFFRTEKQLIHWTWMQKERYI